MIVNFIIQLGDNTSHTRHGYHGRTTQYMIVYMDYVRYYLMLERESRTNDVELYTYALKMLLPIFWATNHPNLILNNGRSNVTFGKSLWDLPITNQYEYCIVFCACYFSLNSFILHCSLGDSSTSHYKLLHLQQLLVIAGLIVVPHAFRLVNQEESHPGINSYFDRGAHSQHGAPRRHTHAHSMTY